MRLTDECVAESRAFVGAEKENMGLKVGYKVFI